MLFEGKENLVTAASFIWLEVELAVFYGLLISNAFFLALRSCVRHKLQLDNIPDRKKLPNIDTVIAIKELTNAFNAQMTPLVVSIYIFI